MSVSPPVYDEEEPLFSGPAKPKLASGYLAQSIAALRNHLDIITFSFFFEIHTHGSSRRNGLRSKLNFVDPYYGLNQAPRISVGEDENIHDSSYS